MRRAFFIVALLLAGSVSVLAQTLDTIYWNQRRADLYYYGSNWYDSSIILQPGISDIYRPSLVNGNGDSYVGRPCITDVPMKVIGIAAPVSFDYNMSLDTVLANRLPESFQLYQHEGDSIYFVDEVLWDTVTPQCKFQINFGYHTEFYDFYEAFFEKPHNVHDTFYVGGTTHNNRFWGIVDEHPEWAYYFEHTQTCYNIFRDNFFIPNVEQYTQHPNPSYFILKYFSEYPYQLSGPYFPNDYRDTSIFYFDTIHSDYWLPFFAIFDTNFVPGVGTYDDSCLAPTGLHIDQLGTTDVALAWNANGMTSWELAVAKLDESLSDGLLVQTPINYAYLDSLEVGYWYKARVRTLCDTDVFGDWSDEVTFYLGTPEDSVSCAEPSGLYVKSTDVGKAVLQWANNPEMLKWQVEYGTEATPVGSGTLMNAPMYFAALNGLEMETWHWARVRAYCASDWTSLWTDTVMFYVPGDGSGPDTNGSDTTTVIDMVEMYTYLMPNPAREEVTVMSSFKVRSVELYAADGKLLKEQEVNAIGTTLDLNGLPAGVYFVRVRTTAGVTTKRLVVE